MPRNALTRNVSGRIARRSPSLSVAERHQLKVARETMRLHCTGARILGGMGDDPHKEAVRVIHALTGRIVSIDPDCTCVARQGKGDR